MEFGLEIDVSRLKALWIAPRPTVESVVRSRSHAHSRAREMGRQPGRGMQARAQRRSFFVPAVDPKHRDGRAALAWPVGFDRVPSASGLVPAFARRFEKRS